MSVLSAISNVFRSGPSVGPFQSSQRRERVSTRDNENDEVATSLNSNTVPFGVEATEEGSFVNSRSSHNSTSTQQSSVSEASDLSTLQNRSRLNLSNASVDASNSSTNSEAVSSVRRPRVVAVRSAASGTRNNNNSNGNTEVGQSESSRSNIESINDTDVTEAASATAPVSSTETDGLSRFTVSAQRATVTLAELEEERELARRRSTACVLFALFILFRLWILALQEADMGLFLVCLIGTSWTARWISYNREQEEELDRRIANYIEHSNNTANGTDAENTINRNDLRLLSFQAQLALAIMESQRQMMEGGYGHPDGENNRSSGVKDEAKAKWNTFLFKPDKHKNLVAKGHYGSVSLHDDDDLVKKPSGLASSQDEEPHCSICLGEYEDGEKLTKLPCGHLFHDECIASWCKNHTRCPLCNYDLNTVTTVNDNLDEIV